MTKYSAWVREALAMFTKDLRSELRTKYALNAIVMFAVVTLAAVSFAVGQFAIGNDVRAAFLWIVLFFSAMSGLGRVFIKEEDANTVHALRLAASPSVVYVGKLAFNTALLFLLAIIVVPLFTVLMGLQVVNLGLFVGVVLLGTAGLAGAATIIAAIIAKASAKGELFAVLAFPILLPLLITAIGGTRVALDGGGGTGEIQFLLSYLVVMVTVSLMLFDFVWND
ncbi:MAG: heme exporter protein CcmB [Chloroflexota bacterium]|nr:heme exporter protein CcmB [Chloroflexota bacterium]